MKKYLDPNKKALVLMIKDRYFAYYKNKRITLSRSLAGAKLFMENAGGKNIDFYEGILKNKGYKPTKHVVEFICDFHRKDHVLNKEIEYENLMQKHNISSNEINEYLKLKEKLKEYYKELECLKETHSLISIKSPWYNIPLDEKTKETLDVIKDYFTDKYVVRKFDKENLKIPRSTCVIDYESLTESEKHRIHLLMEYESEFLYTFSLQRLASFSKKEISSIPNINIDHINNIEKQLNKLNLKFKP